MSMTGTGQSNSRRRWFQRHAKVTIAGVVGIALVLAALLFELFYRVQIVDFYGTELRAFNPSVSEGFEPDSTVLSLGDSFTAGLNAYPNWLQESLGRRWAVVNSGVPGATVQQASLVLSRRLAQFSPRVVVFQTYVGNDLLDLRHPVSWGRVHPVRNCYWLATDLGWSSAGFLNYRLGQIKNRFFGARYRGPERMSPEQIRDLQSRAFSLQEYRTRERLLLAADPWILERQIEVDGGMERAWQRYALYLQRLVDGCRREEIPLVILVVPHSVQVHQRYRDRFLELGARFDRPEVLTAEAYPFVNRIRDAVENEPQVVVIDPLKPLRWAEESGQSMYLNNDAHLQVAGQQLLGRILAEEIALELRRESTNQDGR